MANPFEMIVMRFMRLLRRLHLMRHFWIGTSSGKFKDYFKGFEKNAAVRSIFGEETAQILDMLKVEFIPFGYMGVDNFDGHFLVNRKYLNSGDRTDIYLDVVHELCHVKQWMDKRDLFDYKYDYVDRPTEVEAYRYTVQEAKRLGLNNQRILDYLKTEWMSQEDLKKLVNNMGIDLSLPRSS
jgi:hypothetical protein